MAKSARSSRIKANRSALRKNLHGPVEDARAERLNAKLMELISQPTPSQLEAQRKGAEKSSDDVMELEEGGQADAEVLGDQMEIEQDSTNTSSRTSKKSQRPSSSSKSSSRVQKKRRGKPHAQITFPNVQRNGQRGKPARGGKKPLRKSK